MWVKYLQIKSGVNFTCEWYIMFVGMCVCVIMVIKMVWYIRGVHVFILDVSEYSITIMIKDNQSAIDTHQLNCKTQ